MPTHLCRFTVRTPLGTRNDFSRYIIQRIRFGRSFHVILRNRHFQSAALLLTYVLITLNQSRCRNINLLSIDYAHRPRLRLRLTLGGRTFPRKPWVYGGQEFHLAYRYSCLHPHFLALHLGFPHGFNAPRTLPYHTLLANQKCIQSFGIPLDRQSFLAQDHSMSQLLRTV